MVGRWRTIWQRWQRSQRFETALKQQDVATAVHYLAQMQQADDPLSLLARTFAQGQRSLLEAQSTRQELAQLRRQAQPRSRDLFLKPDPLQVDHIAEQLQRQQHDPHKIQYTGLFYAGFQQLEQAIADYLQDCFEGRLRSKLQIKLQQAAEDLDNLKLGQDPGYELDWSPHVYLLRYFLDNTYCSYASWFWLYELGLLKIKANILDVAAGPGTVAFGLALLLQRLEMFTPDFSHHYSYFSLEKQTSLQNHGFQLWQRWMSGVTLPPNLFMQFQNRDFLLPSDRPNSIQKNSFDYIVISHCFFSEPKSQEISQEFYKQLFQSNLADNGKVILVIQGLKLFCRYQARMEENIDVEQSLIERFCQEMGLTVLHYHYATSTPQRSPMKGKLFGSFAAQNLPCQHILTPLQRSYLNQIFDRHYVLDDYIIIAQPN